MTSLMQDRSNRALPRGHRALSGTHCHGALPVSTPKGSKTRMCCLLWHPARWQALLGVEAVPARRRKRDSGFQREGMPGSSSQLPAACFLPLSLPPATATALLETLSASQCSQPSHRRCPGGDGLVRAMALLSPFPSALCCCRSKVLVLWGYGREWDSESRGEEWHEPWLWEMTLALGPRGVSGNLSRSVLGLIGQSLSVESIWQALPVCSSISQAEGSCLQALGSQSCTA